MITPEIPQLDPMRVQVRKHALMNEISTKPSRRWWRIAVPATGLAAAVAVATLLWSPASPSAYASWTAEPRAPGVNASADADKCRTAFAKAMSPLPRENAGASGVNPKPPPTDTALVDQRGNITLVVLTGPETMGYCMFGSGIWMMGMGELRDGDTWFIATRNGPMGSLIEPVRILTGHVGPEVRSARIATSDGRQVTATIDKGWVAAWWPSYAEATTVTLYDVNGNTLRTVKPENR